VNKERDTQARALGLLGLGAGLSSLAFTLCDKQTVNTPTIDPDRVTRLEEIARDHSEAINLNYYGDYVNEMVQRQLIGQDVIPFADFLTERYEWRKTVKDMKVGK